MVARYPGLKDKLFGAIQRYHLHNWQTVERLRPWERKKPEGEDEN